MIDIHSHILPGIDDGAKDLDESLALLKIAQSDGITHMVATPHIHLGRFNNSTSHLYTDLANLKAHASAAGIALKLAVAAEVRLDIALMALIMANKLPFIGKIEGANYLLLELPHSHVPQGYDKFITWLAKQNVKVIIPHPERNRDIQAQPFYIERLKQLGCEFQLTASSIEGAWGDKAKQISEDYDLNAAMIRRWKREYATKFGDFSKKKELSLEEQELKALRKELKNVKMERDILKKAGCFRFGAKI
jgi:protein-tyrosine phosphatase